MLSDNVQFYSDEMKRDSWLNEKIATLLGYTVVHVYPTGANITIIDSKQVNYQPAYDDLTAYQLMLQEGISVNFLESKPGETTISVWCGKDITSSAIVTDKKKVPEFIRYMICTTVVRKLTAIEQ